MAKEEAPELTVPELERLAKDGDFWDGRFGVLRQLARRVLAAEGRLEELKHERDLSDA